MTQQTIPVTPGITTTVNVQLATGATLYNTDSVNAVWVSTTPGVSPESGIRISPLGSLQWTTDKASCYACLDVGVTQVVNLTVSTDTQNPVNPTDVATATATALLAQGIPNVLTGDIIYNGQLAGTGWGAGQFSVVPKVFGTPTDYMDFTKYASVMLAIYVQDACLLTLQWSDVNAGGTIFTSQPYVITHAPATIYLAQTVKARNLTIQFSLPQLPNPGLQVYASNRVIPDGVTQSDVGYNSSIALTAWGASQQVEFGKAFASKGGTHGIRISSSYAPAVVKGFFGYRYIDELGNSFVNFVTSTHIAVTGPNGETEVFMNTVLPPGILTLLWQNSVTANTYEIKATITAGGN
jgi:hypothetical protein